LNAKIIYLHLQHQPAQMYTPFTKEIMLNLPIHYEDKIKIINETPELDQHDIIHQLVTPTTEHKIRQLFELLNNKHHVMETFARRIYRDIYVEHVQGIVLMFSLLKKLYEINDQSITAFESYAIVSNHSKKMELINFKQIDNYFQKYVYIIKDVPCITDETAIYINTKYGATMPMVDYFYTMTTFDSVMYFLTERKDELPEFIREMGNKITFKSFLMPHFTTAEIQTVRKALLSSSIKRMRKMGLKISKTMEGPTTPKQYEDECNEDEYTPPKYETFAEFYTELKNLVQKYKYFNMIFNNPDTSKLISTNKHILTYDTLIENREILKQDIPVVMEDEEFQFEWCPHVILYHAYNNFTFTKFVKLCEEFDMIDADLTHTDLSYYVFPFLLNKYNGVSMDGMEMIMEKYPNHAICVLTNPRFLYNMEYNEYLNLIKKVCEMTKYNATDMEIINMPQIQTFFYRTGICDANLQREYMPFERMNTFVGFIRYCQQRFLEKKYDPSNIMDELRKRDGIRGMYADT